MQKTCLLVLLLCLQITARGQVTYEYCYWLDNHTNERYYGISDNGHWSIQLDVATLSERLHQLHIQVKDTAGRWSSPRSSFFIKLPVQQDLRARYWFDDDDATENTVTNGIQSIDVSHLSQGVHFLHYQITSDYGIYSPTHTAIFIKNQGQIVHYEYWLNNDVENCRVVAAQPMEPYRLIKLLDVDSHSIRPSAFYFEVKGNVPYVYGKNDFHARFYNSSGLSAEDSATYVDVASKREVKDAILLQSDTRHTDATPKMDSIRWYKLEAYADCSLTFLISQPCSVELFSPTGESLMKHSGEAVTDSFTCHAPIEGIYYMALHSVTGSEAKTSIDYLLGNIKRYEVRYIVDGEVYAVDSIFRGSSIKSMESLTKEGYTFSGWSEVPEVMPGNDVIITGTFVANKYEIVYLLEGEVYHVDTVAYDEDIVVPDAPQKEWYTFDGWGDVPTTMPAHNLQFTGSYSLALELGDVNGDGRLSVVDITILTNEVLKRENVIFISLTADVNGDGRISVVDVTMTTNKIIAEDEE